MAQHLRKHSDPTTEFRKILTDNTTILDKKNSKDYKFLKLEIEDRT